MHPEQVNRHERLLLEGGGFEPVEQEVRIPAWSKQKSQVVERHPGSVQPAAQSKSRSLQPQSHPSNVFLKLIPQRHPWDEEL